jgi:arylsulfatase A-like enzyme
MKQRLRFVDLVVAGLLAGTAPLAAETRPNIIFIMADDLGNADLGYRGGEVITPAIDALATEGVRLEDFYGAPVCTPSRASLMMGRYPMRYGLQSFVIFPGHTYGLDLEERTLPQALAEVGYETWMVGKWHLGHADPAYWPQNRGFDHFYGNVMGEVNYYSKERGGVVDWQRDGTFLQEDGYYTEQIGDEAVRLIQNHDGETPFFLYFASLAPHAPYQAPASYEALYPDEADPYRKTYMGMISALDAQVGEIRAALKEKGLEDNTLIIFASDNAGLAGGSGGRAPKTAEEASEPGTLPPGAPPPGRNTPFRGSKGSLLEGGVRVPGIVWWPKKLAPREVDVPLHMTDIMPTLLGLAGATGDPDRPFDGHDIWPTLVSGAPPADEEVLINVEAFRGAIRVGDWKLIRWAGLPEKVELYNLAEDPSETENQAETQPDILADLDARLMAYAAEQVPSLWLLSQRAFLGEQAHADFGPDWEVSEEGLPTEKAVLPAP